MNQLKMDADHRLQAVVEEELLRLPSVDSTHIGVAVRSGAVTLTGEVAAYPQKQLAGRAVQRVRGVTAIAQELHVRSSWSAVTDSEVAEETGLALRRSVDVPDSVLASVHDNTVTLTGSVVWNFEREAAVRAVRHLKGVVDVVNRIKILPRELDADITESIRKALQRSGEVDPDMLTVKVDAAGRVTLLGAVRSWAERRRAEQACWFAHGVTEVVNELTVSTDS